MKNSSPTIFLLGRDGRGWSIDQDRENTQARLEEAGFRVTKNIFAASHIWCVWLDILLRPRFRWVLLIRKLLGKKIIGAVTNNINEAPEKIPFLKKHIDVCVAPSKKVESFLQSHGLTVVRIPFHVRTSIFKPLEDTREQLAKQLGIDPNSIKDKVLIGSFQRDSLGADLTKQKWQKNPELLVQIMKLLPEQCTLLLAGPRRHYIANRCKEEDVTYIYVGDKSYMESGQDDYPQNVLAPETMNLLYNLADMYVVCSKSEGGPKAVLESALTKTLVLSTNVGFAPDILHPEVIYNVEQASECANLIKQYLADQTTFAGYIEHANDQVTQEFSKPTLKEKFDKILSV